VPTLYFYDLETSGRSPKTSRIMQFAGQRTTMDLEPVGEPHNILVKLTDDILPEPEAILLTGITPQSTQADGLTEAEFLKLFCAEIATPDTTFIGYNNIRFDDHFMRYTLYRNFYDAYEWQWCEGCGKWDLLDVIRMTRALRPEGIKWPFTSDGKPTNRLELITSLNGLDHEHAHDALNDVLASIAVAKLIKTKQPKLYDYLWSMRDKKAVAALVETGQPFVYSSGKYPSEFEKTTVAVALAPHHSKSGCQLVYDLRHDPAEFAKLNVAELMERARYTKDEQAPPRLPVKNLSYNHCPAVAPLAVLDAASQKRLQLDLATIQKHAAALKKLPELRDNIQEVHRQLEEQFHTSLLGETPCADEKLYDGFLQNGDKQKCRALREAAPEDLTAVHFNFDDARLNELLPLYKARNYPRFLTGEERQAWEDFRRQKLLGSGKQRPIDRFFSQLQTIASRPNLTSQDQYILEELHLWAQSILPADD
jgi:exodeoxyribonuclease-1